MAPKKKTVKDLVSEMEIFESKIKEMERVFEKMKAIKLVDKENSVIRKDGSQKQTKLVKKLIELEKKLEEAQDGITILENSPDPKTKKVHSNCNRCNLTFEKKNDLKVHQIAVHPKQLNRDFCDQTFELKWKLETHLKTHKQSMKYPCDSCGNGD